MAKRTKRTKRKAAASARRPNKPNVLESLWKLVEDNPEVALALAFEIGALVSEATRSRGNVKGLLMKQMERGARLLPQLLSGANSKVPPAMKILAEPALQAAIAAHSGQRAARQAKRKTRR
ncbi:MAG: hypothetical protein JO254_04820 [Pseudolabrys sp.]|nr:hypothetical protein [Pseudolabrys sp.]